MKQWAGRGLVSCGVLAALGVSMPASLQAQTATRVYRIGVLRPTIPPPKDDPINGLIESALAELGYAVPRNEVIETRYARGSVDKLPELARELVQLKLDVAFTVGSSAARAMRAAAPSMPIVFFGNLDPVALGLVSNLAQPGGYATGVLISSEGTLAAKRLQLLKEAVPKARRIALLAPNDPGFRLQSQEVHKAAAELDLTLIDAVVSGGDYDNAFERAVAAKADAMFVGATTYAFIDRKRIIELAAKHRLPATYEWPEQAQDGGFMAYGTSMKATYGRIASYIDRILRGERPGDLPVVQPTQFELVINLATAKALAVTIPQSVLLRADRVIE
jgi:putative ABC transport system substrate-binding protein